MESDDLSGFETTVPTDLSLSPDEEASELGHVHDGRRSKISKQLLQRKQILHDYQLLKIELSQKSLIIDNMKADYMQKVEELEEKLCEALHQKQILQARLESQLKIQQDDSRRRQEQIQREMVAILKRQQQLEATNERLQERAVDIRKSLKDLELTENQYREGKLQNEEELSLKDFVAIKLFESVKPWKTENEDLRSRVKSLTDDFYKCKSTLEKCSDELDEEKRNHTDIQIKHQKLTLAFADTKTQVQHGDYKIENYERVKSERDSLEDELSDLRKQHGYLDAAHQGVTKERDDLNSQLNSSKQSISLLQQDKDYFSKQASELHNKLLYTEERLIQLNDQMERAKQSREDLYDKYVSSRDQYKSEYEAKLRDELEQIRVRTNLEIDRLKTGTKEMFERENRSLREARDMALSEKERAVVAERDSNTKYEQLLQEFRQLQIGADNKMSEMNSEVKLRCFESERTQMVHEETVRTLKDCQMEDERLTKKLEVLTKEYYSLQTSLEKRVSELESEVKEKTSKLETYEKLEQELDEVVMQSAEIEDESEAERVLFSYGYGANVPTTSKRRLKQSVHLARRVLQLERANTSMRKEIDRDTEKHKQLAEELKNANTLLDQSQQPYHYLVEGMRVRDAQITKQKQHIASVEQDLSQLQKENGKLGKSKNQMSADLERLLNQKEEMSVMKQVVTALGQRRTTDKSSHFPLKSSRTPRSTRSTPRSPKGKPANKKTAVHQLHPTFEPEKDDNICKPAPTQFTVNEPPDWYARLKLKGKTDKSKYSTLYEGAA